MNSFSAATQWDRQLGQAPGPRLEISMPVVHGLTWSTLEKVFVAAASVFFLILAIGTIRTESLTDNEMLFIPAAVSYVQAHDGRMDIEEPPLVKLIAGASMLPLHPKVDYSDPAWTTSPGSGGPEYEFGQKFFEVWNRNHRAMLFAARLPMVAITLCLGLSLYYMARRIAGRWGAALTLGLFITSPFFYAYGTMVHMDIPIVLFCMWTMWFFAELWQRPTLGNAAWFGASLGAALATKFSGVFLFPAILVTWLWFRYGEFRARKSAPAVKTLRREALALAGMAFAGVIVCSVYFWAFHKSDTHTIISNEAASTMAGRGVVPVMDVLDRRLQNYPALAPVLLPATFYSGGLSYVVSHGSRPFYFLGRIHQTGVWYYFPVMFLLKLAPGMVFLVLMLAALAVYRLSRRKGNRAADRAVPAEASPHVRSMSVCLIVFAGIAIASSLDVGIRHFSVPIGICVLLVSLLVPVVRTSLAPSSSALVFTATACLALSSLVTAIAAYPNYLAYFNFLRFGMPKQEIANNSNLNWGQAGQQVADFFRAHGVPDPYVDDISTVDPTLYLPGAHAWECDQADPPPSAEWVAVSAYKLQHGPGNCLSLLRYRSWTIGDGAVVAFHIGSSQPSVQAHSN